MHALVYLPKLVHQQIHSHSHTRHLLAPSGSQLPQKLIACSIALLGAMALTLPHALAFLSFPHQIALTTTTAIESLKFPPAALAFTAKPNHHVYTQTLQASQYTKPNTPLYSLPLALLLNLKIQ
ncbi:hypothetical protein FCV25MIE_16779, partial [Fagus crenata]